MHKLCDDADAQGIEPHLHVRRLLSRGIPALISAYASFVPNNGAKRIRESNEQQVSLRFKHQHQELPPADRPPRNHSDDYGALHHRRSDALPLPFDSLRGAHADYGSPLLHDAHFTSYYDVHPPLRDSFGHGYGAPSRLDALQQVQQSSYKQDDIWRARWF